MKAKLGFAVALLVAATAGAAERPRGAPAGEREFTLGLVQKEVRLGMAQADVVTALGSPNLLTRDGQGREAWVYDKIASEARYQSSGFGAGGGGLGTPGTSLLLGVLSGHRRIDKASATQRTLTVVIRFDAFGRVESFSYHATRF